MRSPGILSVLVLLHICFTPATSFRSCVPHQARPVSLRTTGVPPATPVSLGSAASLQQRQQASCRRGVVRAALPVALGSVSIPWVLEQAAAMPKLAKAVITTGVLWGGYRCENFHHLFSFPARPSRRHLTGPGDSRPAPHNVVRVFQPSPRARHPSKYTPPTGSCEAATLRRTTGPPRPKSRRASTQARASPNSRVTGRRWRPRSAWCRRRTPA